MMAVNIHLYRCIYNQVMEKHNVIKLIHEYHLCNVETTCHRSIHSHTLLQLLVSNLCVLCIIH